jgi:hypothetical protein
MYITVTDASPTAGSYTITSNTRDGLSFSTSGHFTGSGTFAVEVPARGTVTSSKIKHFTLTTNSRDGEATCNFTVTPIIPQKTVYSYYSNALYPITSSPQRDMLESRTNFGPAGTVKYEGFNAGNLLGRGNTANTLINDLKSSTPPDIIHVTYDIRLSTAEVNAIVNYAKKGGVVLITIEDEGYIRNLINGLFDIRNAATSSLGNLDNALFTLPALDNDPIINGPFGNLGDKTFAFDGGWNDVITNIPPNKVTVYSTDAVGSANAPTEGVVGAFKHNTLNVVFFPDGGTLSSDGGTSMTRHPVNVGKSPTYLPITKEWTGGVAYNSQLLCNIMAWALNQAQYYGINSDKYK